MEYTINKLAKLAGVTPRTLRYYDQIGLLHPCRLSSSGYRIYGREEVDKLQQILFYRSLDFPLEKIRLILEGEDYNVIRAMEEQKSALVKRKEEIEGLIQAVEKTIAYRKGDRKMSDKEKFESFKKQKVKENEEKFGKEVQEKYGKKALEDSNAKFLNLRKEDLDAMNRLEEELIEILVELAQTGDILSEKGRQAYLKHKEWLCFSWPSYNPQAHIGLAQTYVADERFSQYYREKAGVEVAEILRDVITAHAK